MFTFSFLWLQALNGQPIVLEELLEILNLQGLEVKKKVNTSDGDTVITIEVKANRSFCLSYLGLLREYRAYKGLSEPIYFNKNLPSFEFSKSLPNFPVEIKTKLCARFAGIIIRHLNNRGPTSESIAQGLQKVGLNSVNPVVDILNTLMLETGQPLHAYDLKKIEGLRVSKNPKARTFVTLNQTDATLPKSSIVIEDKKNILAAAGVIGAAHCAVECGTTDIFIECAIFEPAAIRVASRAMRIFTPSAFRFERGVDSSQIPQVLGQCAMLIQKVCGGEIEPLALNINALNEKPITFTLRPSQVNQFLGIRLSKEEMVACLHRYYFKAEAKPHTIKVSIPSYRQDIKESIALIGEIGRIHGFHRVMATLPRLPLTFKHNDLWDLSEKMRTWLMGLGCYEVMTYSFIPAQAIQILSWPDRPVILENPLSQDHAVMRPTLLYSLIQCLAYNYSIGNKNISLFEIGKTYHHQESNPAIISDTGYWESDQVGILLSGNRIERGFGLVKDIMYGFYDVQNYLSIIMSELGLSFSLQETKLPGLVEGSAFTILVGQEKVGHLGQVESRVLHQIPNGKLIHVEAFFLMLNLNNLKSQPKTIHYKSIFPPIIREYNFLLERNRSVSDIITSIRQGSSLIQSVDLKDIYEGHGIKEGHKAVLVEVKYSTPDRTLTAEEVTQVESQFLKVLQKSNIYLPNFCE